MSLIKIIMFTFAKIFALRNLKQQEYKYFKIKG
jgi:hypothetical protein